MRVLRDSGNGVASLELFESELCEQMGATAEELRGWQELFPPSDRAMHPERERPETIYRLGRDELERWVQMAKILKTGMTVKQVRELQQRDEKARRAGKKANFVEMYSLLAEECPVGITAHAMRSYCTVFLYQNRGGRMLLSKDLARAAQIPEESALRHIKYLQAVGLLTLGRDAQGTPRWEFALVPKALTKYYPE